MDVEIPAGVRQPLLWRLAEGLVRGHVAEAAAPTDRPPRCRCCRQAWPCLGRRLGERGRAVAFLPPTEDGP